MEKGTLNVNQALAFKVFSHLETLMEFTEIYKRKCNDILLTTLHLPDN